MTYKLTHVDNTEEFILNNKWPNKNEPATRWRRFRINYRNEWGHSNIEGTLYFPPGIDPDPILESLCKELSKAITSA